MFSLLFPQMRGMGAARRPQPFTAGRQALLVALIVVILGYPAGRWLADHWFIHLADSTAAAIAADPDLLAAIRSQNAAKAGETQAEIDRVDRLWIEERKNPQGALTAALLAHRPRSACASILPAVGGS